MVLLELRPVHGQFCTSRPGCNDLGVLLKNSNRGTVTRKKYMGAALSGQEFEYLDGANRLKQIFYYTSTISKLTKSNKDKPSKPSIRQTRVLQTYADNKINCSICSNNCFGRCFNVLAGYALIVVARVTKRLNSCNQQSPV